MSRRRSVLECLRATTRDGVDLPRFVDRESELSRLDAAREEAVAGRSRLVLIGGEAGIGKTALLQAFVARQGAAPASVAWSSTPVAVGEQVPYAAIADLVRDVAGKHPSAVDELGQAATELEAIVPGVTGDRSLSDPGPDGDPTFARIRLLETVRSLLEEAARAQAPLTLVIEDLHWADAASLEAVAYLERQLRAPVLLLASYRTDALARSEALEQLLIELVRMSNVDHIRLPGLDPPAVRDMVPRLSTRRSRDLAERTGGNPYFITELLSGSERGAALPSDLVEFLAQRLDRLSTPARRVAQAAAVAGRLASTALISAVTGLALGDVRTSLRELIDANVVASPGPTGSAYQFSSPLMQEVVVAHLLPDELESLHASVAAALADDALSRATGATSVDIALQWSAAGAGAAAVRPILAGADEAERKYAFETAHALLESVLTLLPADDQRRPVLALRAAELAALAGRGERAVALGRDALRGSNKSDTPRVLERLASFQLGTGNFDDALATFDQALAQLPSDSSADDQRGRLLASRGRALMLAGRYDEARTSLEGAVASARSAGSRADESRALSSLASVMARSGDTAGAAAALAHARSVDERRGESVVAPRPSRIGYVIAGLLDRAEDLERAGAHDDAIATLSEAGAEASRLGAAHGWGGLAVAQAANELFLLGRWHESDALLSEEDDAIVSASPELLAVRARLMTARGDVDAAQALIDVAQPHLQSLSGARLADLLQVLAEISLWRGRAEDAAEAVERAQAELAGSQDESAFAELAALGLRAAAQRVESAHARRAAAETEKVRESALALAAAAGIGGRGAGKPDRLGALQSLCEAWLSFVMGDPDPRLWQRTVNRFDVLREPYNAALARWWAGEALLARGGGRPAAEAMLTSAYATAQDLGAAPLAAEIDALARRARLELAPRDDAAPRHADPHAKLRAELGLSARELEVLALVAQGRTNRQIADELFITEKTAGHHVSNILTKLDAATRVEAAAIAHRAGVLPALDAAR